MNEGRLTDAEVGAGVRLALFEARRERVAMVGPGCQGVDAFVAGFEIGQADDSLDSVKG